MVPMLIINLPFKASFLKGDSYPLKMILRRATYTKQFFAESKTEKENQHQGFSAGSIN